MKLKKYRKNLLGFGLLMLSTIASGQITVTNKSVSITNTRSSIYFNGNYVNDSTSKIANGGIIYFRNDITNTANNNMFITDAGKVVIDGSKDQHIFGDSSINFFKLDLNKTSNNLILAQNIVVNDTLEMANGNIDLNGNDIDLRITGELTSETNDNRIYGNSGFIKARRNINNPTISQNISGLGLYISSSENFGYVRIERGHAQQTSNEDTSIFRYYNFIPKDTSTQGMIDSLKISYLDNTEIVSGEVQYKIFSSVDDGTQWSNKGGIVDTANNFVLTTTISPPVVGKIRLSIFPIESFATCLPNDPNFISAVFLVASRVLDGDSVKFVQLSNPNPQNYTWNFGDGTNSIEDSPTHNYNLPIDTISSQYEVAMTVTNGICSDTRKKLILVNPVPPSSLRNSALYSGIEFVNLFPNPNFGNFNLEIKTTEEKDIAIYITDMQGRLLEKRFARTSSYKEELNFTFLNPGMYFIKLQVGEELRVLKMIKL